MEKWEKAVEEFLKKYENEEFFEGALICGSYVAGNNDEFSDIDIHIVLKRNNSWRERGNVVVNGFLIEYFANPVNQYEKEMDEEVDSGGNHTTSMFAKGIAVRDRTGLVASLKEKALRNANNKVKEISDFKLKCYQYSSWSRYDELVSSYKHNRDSFCVLYYELYKVLVDFLTDIRRIRPVTLAKMDKLIDSDKFRENYGINEFFNKEDSNIIRECMIYEDKDKMFDKITKFYKYVLDLSGGFDIEKFVLRSDLL